MIDQAGTSSNAGWSAEEALDVEWSHAIAPNARIVVVEAASPTTRDLLNAIGAARTTPGVSVVSMSFGGPGVQRRADLRPDLHHARRPYRDHLPGLDRRRRRGGPVAGVVAQRGRRRRHVAFDQRRGARVSESAWTSTGGGVSQYEPEPAYQKSVQSSGHREVADVAAVGDPNTGVLIYTTSAGGWEQVGGTSLSAPVWGAIVAITDQGRSFVGKGTLDGATQTLPMLYSAPAGSFYDVASGFQGREGLRPVHRPGHA